MHIVELLLKLVENFLQNDFVVSTHRFLCVYLYNTINMKSYLRKDPKMEADEKTSFSLISGCFIWFEIWKNKERDLKKMMAL